MDTKDAASQTQLVAPANVSVAPPAPCGVCPKIRSQLIDLQSQLDDVRNELKAERNAKQSLEELIASNVKPNKEDVCNFCISCLTFTRCLFPFQEIPTM